MTEWVTLVQGQLERLKNNQSVKELFKDLQKAGSTIDQNHFKGEKSGFLESNLYWEMGEIKLFQRTVKKVETCAKPEIVRNRILNTD